MTPELLAQKLRKEFSVMVVIEAQPDGCWYCVGKYPDANGYIRHKDLYLHRLVLELTSPNTPRVEEYHTLHSCDVRKCVNPAHLRWGTPADNVQDMMNKGRCSKHLNCNLTFDQIREIRATSKRQKKTLELAIEYGVRSEVIRNIRNNVTYQGV